MENSGNGKLPPKNNGGGERWVCAQEVWHARGKRFIKRKDGKPFRFPIKPRKPKG